MPPSQIPKPPENSGNDLKTLRTLSSDLAEAIREGNASKANVVIAENDRRHREEGAATPQKKSGLYLVGGIVLLFVGVLAIVFFFMKKSAPVTTVNTQSRIPTLFVPDSLISIDIANKVPDDTKGMIAAHVTSDASKLNTIEQIYFTNAAVPLSAQNFFIAIGTKMPARLTRSLDPMFEMGIHAFSGNSLFVIYKTNDPATAFSGMLEYETTLFDDYYKMFGIDITGDHAGLFSAKWSDRVVKNQDARVLTDSSGKVVLMYAFLGSNKDTLIITDRDTTLDEVVRRITGTGIVR